jgi:7,8-dihydro-6-hydroxymethylpterin dimethyltransferase
MNLASCTPTSGHAAPTRATLSAAGIAALTPLAAPSADPTGALRDRMQRTGQWTPNQMAGRRWPVACVSLEITQRCNLDCTLCYLSDSSEAVRDFPLEEVMRRIELIHAHYGPGTDVQVSGGEPTLRRRDELLAIIAKIASLGMRASLFTNGIKATRELLEELAAAGLTDVAFHVDTTQQRAGYANEAELNALRSEYIERARGLPLSVFFNTTVHAGNFDDVPALTAFFVRNADVVRFASFQLQAETGRGVLGARAEAIDNHSVAARLQRGVGTALRFNVLQAGHSECNRSAVLLAINGRAYDAFEDEAFVGRFMRETAQARIDRGTPWRAFRSLLGAALGVALRLESATRPDRLARPSPQADAVHAQLHGCVFARRRAH